MRVLLFSSVTGLDGVCTCD